MRTLIVPCMGNKKIDGIPQYILEHPCGKMNLLRSVEGVWSECYDKLLIVLGGEDEEKFPVERIIRDVFKSYPLEIVVLDRKTNGPAETVYWAVKRAEITGSIVIKDNDSYIRAEVAGGNFVVGLDLNAWVKDIYNLRNKSFLIINEQKNILDIIEKRICSPVISIGLYGFNHVESFIKAYERLNDPNYPISGLYVSHIISYLIGYSNKVFRFVNASEYENWGSDKLWRELKEEYEINNCRS
ncbi:MAG: hypothetical protein ACI35P_02255 [Bacillus sp. (in: firmicutes)]